MPIDQAHEQNDALVKGSGGLAPYDLDKATGLPFFHSFTGSDTTLSFLRRGKKIALEAWNSFPEITSVFSKVTLKILMLNLCISRCWKVYCSPMQQNQHNAKQNGIVLSEK